METREFIDHYEILEISPNANSGTIERMFRHLARLYHPDNKETGDRIKFDLILQANNTLRDPVSGRNMISSTRRTQSCAGD